MLMSVIEREFIDALNEGKVKEWVPISLTVRLLFIH